MCVCMCVSFSSVRCPSSVLGCCPVRSVHSAFCHPYAGLPVLLLCVLAAVHPNMALLPTGITSVRSASTRSRATVWPWGTTRHSHRRKLPGLGGYLVIILRDYQAVFSVDLFYGKKFQSEEPTWTWLSLLSFSCSMILKDQFEKKKNDMLDPEPWVLSGQ